MSSKKDVYPEVQGIIEDLEDSESQKAVDTIKNQDPMLGLRNSLIDFIETRLSVVDDEEQFRTSIKNAIKTKIQNDEVSITQLITLLKTVDQDTTNAVESILSLLKPNQNGEVSPLFDRNRGDSGVVSDELENMEPQKQELIHKLGRVIQAFESESNESENKG